MKVREINLFKRLKLYLFGNSLGSKSVQGVSSHGKPGNLVMEFHFVFPGLEKSWNLTPGFGKNHKSHGNYKVASCETARFCSSFKSRTSTQGYWYVRHENRNRFNLFHHILFKMTPNHTWYDILPLCPQYMSLSCHKSCKR